ncbi:MAG: mercuric transport protein [Gammaproteobacteria bacterium HGW-Gammaproteobacteria-8]|nr:MAG: mercuric transport protein [Gammaproteobacteria bacterium HGW-Gammaproteobacteria-8]
MSKHDTPAINPAASSRNNANRGLLALGGLGAAIASACCILPFVLVVMGLGGAWLANLHALYPYRWLFIGAAAVALFFAWRRLYRPRTECAEGEVCAVPEVKLAYRVLFWTIAGLVALSAIAPYVLGAILS